MKKNKKVAEQVQAQPQVQQQGYYPAPYYGGYPQYGYNYGYPRPMQPQTAMQQNMAQPTAQNQEKPVNGLNEKRNWAKMFFLGIITLGIYPMLCWYRIACDINLIAYKHDGKRTMSFWLLMCIIGPVTCEIGTLVWMHKLTKRIGEELKTRNINYKLSPKHFWLWNTLGLLIVVGPLVYLHKVCKAMNLLSKDYNQKG